MGEGVWVPIGGGSGGNVASLSGFDGTNPVFPDIEGNINIIGQESIDNNLEGLNTRGNAINNTLFVQLTNRIQGFVTTADDTPTTLINYHLGNLPGVYSFEGNIEAFDKTNTEGAVYHISASVRTTGAAAMMIGPAFQNVFEEATIADSLISVSVAANALILDVTGIAATNIDWRGLINYRFIS